MSKGYLAALKTEYHAQKLRKQGRDAVIAVVCPKEATVRLPVITVGLGLLDTVEGCTLWNHTTKPQRSALMAAYRAVDEPTRRAMAYSPKRGEFVRRAAWWRDLLEGVLAPEDVPGAMVAVISWYRRIIAMGYVKGAAHE